MQWAGEPKLEEVLSDPIVRAVMDRDGVDQEGLRGLLRNATRLLALRSDDATNGNAAGSRDRPGFDAGFEGVTTVTLNTSKDIIA